jgi:hypothetical protein
MAGGGSKTIMDRVDRRFLIPRGLIKILELVSITLSDSPLAVVSHARNTTAAQIPEVSSKEGAVIGAVLGVITDIRYI